MNKEELQVLVIDDEPGMCLGAQRVLDKFQVEIEPVETRVSFTTEFIHSCKEFETLPAPGEYDLVLLDYKLPDGTGLELQEHLLSLNPDLIIIMITAYATFETAVQAAKKGAFDFLAKPFTPDDLRYSIKKAANQILLSRKAKEFEEEKKKLRFQFISVLSHELKAPISAIEGYVDILSTRYDTISREDYESMLSRSKLRLEGMRKLIYDLLDLTRIESGEKTRTPIEFDIRESIDSAIELVLTAAKEKNIQIETEIQSAVPFTGDKGEIEIVLNNLVSNAVKYNKQNGMVNIKAQTENGRCTITVSDTGIGISREEQKQLFEDFVRIKNENTRGILGTGLGLSTIKKIASLYNGTVTLTSTPGQGSTFTVTLQPTS